MTIKKIISSCVSALLAGCGGGEDPSSDQTNTARTVTAINAAAALQNFNIYVATSERLDSNDGTLNTAFLMTRNEESQTFITESKNYATTTTRLVQFQLQDYGGKRGRQYIWKLHLDPYSKPNGMAFAQEINQWDNKTCLTNALSNDLPVLTNGSGNYFEGRVGSYFEDFRDGKYANYCDVNSESSGKAVEWSVVDGTPLSYFCITFPSLGSNPKTRICFPASVSGLIVNTPWIRTYAVDGTPGTDYKDVTMNKPVEDLSGPINPNDYWYGSVIRAGDGYLYKNYEETKFPSRVACQNQTQIDWKKIWEAVNITWSCTNVITKAI